MVAVILGSAYATSDGGEQEPCPFCGSTDTSWREGGPYSYDQIYCNHCLTEFTFYPPAGTHRIGGPQLTETLERWNQRADPDPDWCPFCGCEAVEFDGIMNYSTFFADAYCPDCRVRFEFQKVRKGKVEVSNLKKAKKAFGRRDNGR